MTVYVAPTLADGTPYPAAMWQAALDEVARLSALSVSGWTAVTLVNSWTNRAGYGISSFKTLFGSTLFIVLNLAAGLQTNGTTIFTLPAGFRPLSKVQIPLTARIAATGQQMGALEIDTAGAAKIFDIGASATLHAAGFIPLDL